MFNKIANTFSSTTFKIAALTIGLAAATSAAADTYNPYTYQSGNTYRVQEYPTATTVSGFNYSTGSTWSGTYRSNGSSSGIDKNGNYWTYNNNTGAYRNSNGKTCYGKGSSRVCY